MRRYGRRKNIRRWSLKESGFTAPSPFGRTIKCIMDSDAKINGKLHTHTDFFESLNKRSIKIMNFFFLLLIAVVVVALIHVPSGSRKKLHRSRPHRANERNQREKSLREKSVRIILRALSSLMRWFHCANNFQTASIAYNIPFFNSSFGRSSSPYSAVAIDRAGSVQRRINGSIHGAAYQCSRFT